MTQHEQKIQSHCIAAFMWLKELIDRCEDCHTEHKLRDVQTAIDELYDDWLAHVEPAEETAMIDQYKIPNHFERIENLLLYRDQILAPFDNFPCDVTLYKIQHKINSIFYKAIVEEMRDIVDAYDREFNV